MAAVQRVRRHALMRYYLIDCFASDSCEKERYQTVQLASHFERQCAISKLFGTDRFRFPRRQLPENDGNGRQRCDWNQTLLRFEVGVSNEDASSRRKWKDFVLK